MLTPHVGTPYILTHVGTPYMLIHVRTPYMLTYVGTPYMLTHVGTPYMLTQHVGTPYMLTHVGIPLQLVLILNMERVILYHIRLCDMVSLSIVVYWNIYMLNDASVNIQLIYKQ